MHGEEWTTCKLDSIHSRLPEESTTKKKCEVIHISSSFLLISFSILKLTYWPSFHAACKANLQCAATWHLSLRNRGPSQNTLCLRSCHTGEDFSKTSKIRHISKTFSPVWLHDQDPKCLGKSDSSVLGLVVGLLVWTNDFFKSWRLKFEKKKSAKRPVGSCTLASAAQS